MPTPTDDRRELLTVIANMRAKPGREQDLRAALEALIEPTTGEDGYVNDDLHQAVDDPAVFYFYENWEPAAALDAHLSTLHLEQFAARIDELLAEPGLTIARLQRIV